MLPICVRVAPTSTFVSQSAVGDPAVASTGTHRRGDDGVDRPSTWLLDDAFAITADAAVPDAIKKAAVPVLCREAFEATAWDVFSSRALAKGQTRGEVEDTWEKASPSKRRIGLAADPDDDAAFDKWLAGGSARRHAKRTATKGAHSGLTDYKDAVKLARLAAGDFAKLAS